VAVMLDQATTTAQRMRKTSIAICQATWISESYSRCLTAGSRCAARHIMSAQGHLRTLARPNGMSALPPKAEIGRRQHNVRDVPKAAEISDDDKRQFTGDSWRRDTHLALEFGRAAPPADDVTGIGTQA